jgi:hypothetical protein|tara:strand:+ start:141 stop:359 length:219 start_codon:yes stop_codon:yes gene_type:complete
LLFTSKITNSSLRRYSSEGESAKLIQVFIGILLRANFGWFIPKKHEAFSGRNDLNDYGLMARKDVHNKKTLF